MPVAFRQRSGSLRWAWSLAVIAVLLQAAQMLAGVRYGQPSDSLVEGIGVVLVTAGFAVAGGIVAARVPHNPLGWLLLGLAVVGPLLGMLEVFFHVSQVHVLAGRPALPGTLMGLLLQGLLLSVFLFARLTFIPLLFPDGRLPSPRWRAVGGLAIAAIAAWTAAGGVAAILSPTDALTSDDATTSTPIVNVLAVASVIMAVAAAVASLGSLVVRWRRARGEERQQLKWFGFGIALTLVGVLAETQPLDVVLAAGWSGLPDFIGDVAELALPASIGIALTRYRLYEIDRLINRTVVYTIVTGLLLVVYFATIGGLQAVVAPLVGSQLAVAVSTLTVAAAFQPLRRVVQRKIDRRFNRTRYDARHSVATFQASLRDGVDVDMLTHQLLAAAATTMNPTHVRVWLVETQRERGTRSLIRGEGPQ